MKIKILMLGLLFFPVASQSFDQQKIDDFAVEVSARHALDEAWIREILATATTKESILKAISRPAEKARPWHEYRALFINDRRINDGVKFWNTHQDTLRRVSDECGIPAEIIVAILGIETHYGTRAGGFRIIDALSTLAFEYPPRSKFFRSELEQFFLLVQEHDIDPLTAQGSYAGAMGAAQFISSSYRNYAVDGSGDGRIDLWQDWRDVIGSVGNYLHTFGWQANEPVTDQVTTSAATAATFKREKLGLDHTAGALRQSGIQIDKNVADDKALLLFELENTGGPEYWVGYKNFYVITRYNHSTMYAKAVIDLGAAIAEKVRLQ